MKKTKKTTRSSNSKKIDIRKAIGVFYKDVLWYYDSSSDFVEAWPGIKMWIGVEAGK